MKGELLFLLVLLMILPACAGAVKQDQLTNTSSWQEIESQLDVIPEAPMIFFGPNAVPVMNVCLDHEKLRAERPTGQAEIPRGNISRDYNIRVDQVVGGGEVFNRKYLFTKHYQIPECGQG